MIVFYVFGYLAEMNKVNRVFWLIYVPFVMYALNVYICTCQNIGNSMSITFISVVFVCVCVFLSFAYFECTF